MIKKIKGFVGRNKDTIKNVAMVVLIVPAALGFYVLSKATKPINAIESPVETVPIEDNSSYQDTDYVSVEEEA